MRWKSIKGILGLYADKDTNNLSSGLVERELRVFISSTFRDMSGEREELVKKIFPQIRKKCQTRDVNWGEIDLRWGITEEQSNRGEVLPICLSEIGRSNIFLGILGERYGFVPHQIEENLLNEHEWLREHKNHSITDLEIQHGVIKNKNIGKAFFYFRDPGYILTIDEEQRQFFYESPTPDEIREFGYQRAETLANARKEKLKELKEKIEKNKFPVRYYKNLDEFGELVLKDLNGVIDETYPENLTESDKESYEHEMVIKRYKQIYVERIKYNGRLDNFIAGNENLLTVLGEAGTGKSALLANWGSAYRKENINDLVLMHFVGADLRVLIGN